MRGVQGGTVLTIGHQVVGTGVASAYAGSLCTSAASQAHTLQPSRLWQRDCAEVHVTDTHGSGYGPNCSHSVDSWHNLVPAMQQLCLVGREAECCGGSMHFRQLRWHLRQPV